MNKILEKLFFLFFQSKSLNPTSPKRIADKGRTSAVSLTDIIYELPAETETKAWGILHWNAWYF